MEQGDDGYIEANMLDARYQYAEGGQMGQGPYYSHPQIDPNLANLLNDDIANMDLDNTHGSPLTIAKNGKKKQAVAFDNSASEPASEEESGPEPENDLDEDFDPEEEEQEHEQEEITPEKPLATATRKVLKPKTSKTPKKGHSRTMVTPRRTPRKSGGRARDAVPSHRQRKPPKNGITGARAIARSYEECDEADKALIDMRDVDRKTWKEVRMAWEELTGQKTGVSTLPNRYDRLKDNFSIIKEEDRPRLLEAKDDVEREMNRKKWVLIAEKVQLAGGDKYTPDQLQRQWKKLMVREGLRPPPGIVDADFNIAISDEEYDD